MTIKILTPELLIFEGEVDSVLVPGENGDFHIFPNHAAVVSALKTGEIRIFAPSIPEKFAGHFRPVPEDSQQHIYCISSGVLEFYNNNGILLCEV